MPSPMISSARLKTDTKEKEQTLDYFQGVVTEYLRANRAVFVNTECLIQLDEGDKQFKDRHWYCDAMAVNFKDKAIYLCEITYSGTMQSLVGRLQAWQSNWAELTAAVIRDSGTPRDWTVQPWVFIPQKRRDVFDKKMALAKPVMYLMLAFGESESFWAVTSFNEALLAIEINPFGA